MVIVEIKNVGSLRDLVDTIEENFGADTDIAGLTLVTKSDGWDIHSFNYESGYVYEIK